VLDALLRWKQASATHSQGNNPRLSLALNTKSLRLGLDPLLSLALCPKGCFPASLLPGKQGSRGMGNNQTILELSLCANFVEASFYFA